MSSFRVWSLSLSVAVAASLFPFEKPLSGERGAEDFGSCLIDQAITQSSSDIQGILSHCAQGFDQSAQRSLKPWASVGQCYDAFQAQAPSQQAAMLVFKGCSWYFKEQQA